jgi:hypothetical protein
MKFYKAKKKIEDGKILYGNLPYKYVIGYEDEEYAYFELPDNIKLPGKKDNDIKIIDETIYKNFVDNLKTKENEKRQIENTEMIEKIKNKKEENRKSKSQFETLLQILQSKNLLTAEEYNQIINS